MIWIIWRRLELWGKSIALTLVLTLGNSLIGGGKVYAVSKTNAEVSKPSKKAKTPKPVHQLWGIVGVIADYSAGKEKGVVVLKNYVNQKTYTVTVGDRLPASNLILVSAARKDVQVYDGKNYHTLNMAPAEVAQVSNGSEGNLAEEAVNLEESQILGARDAYMDYYGGGQDTFAEIYNEHLLNGEMTESQRSFLKAYRDALRAAVTNKFRNQSVHEFGLTAQTERADHAPSDNLPYGDQEMTFDEWTSVNSEYRESGH